MSMEERHETATVVEHLEPGEVYVALIKRDGAWVVSGTPYCNDASMDQARSYALSMGAEKLVIAKVRVEDR